MQMPDFLPDELCTYQRYQDDSSLFKALARNPSELAIFFDYACNDPTWRTEHPYVIRSTLRWVAKHYYLEEISEQIAKHVVAVIQKNYVYLKPFLFFRPALYFTMGLRVEGKIMRVNTLLFGVVVPLFKNIFKTCFENLVDEWPLSKIRLPTFNMIQEYVIEGTVHHLQLHEEEEVRELMVQAHIWQLKELEEEAAEELRRYLTRDNVLDTIIGAHRSGYYALKAEAYHFFNQLGYGLELQWASESNFKVKIFNDRLDTWELFKRMAPWITHLALGDELTLAPKFRTWVEMCPKLIGFDLSGSSIDADQLALLPSLLQELDLSDCSWLDPPILQKAGERFPQLKKLGLAGNTQLSFQAWAQLIHFPQLISLNVARCHQINDEDLKQIGRGAPHLVELNLEGCRQITPQGMAELRVICPHLSNLSS